MIHLVLAYLTHVAWEEHHSSCNSLRGTGNFSNNGHKYSFGCILLHKRHLWCHTSITQCLCIPTSHVTVSITVHIMLPNWLPAYSVPQDEGYRDPNTGEIRRVPFEIMVEGDKVPIYEETLEDVRRFNENPALPFNAFGTLALARAEFDANSGSSQVFFLLKVSYWIFCFLIAICLMLVLALWWEQSNFQSWSCCES